jgi:hypothetical protein
MKIFKIVIDGGPCGGKTIGLSRLQEHLSDTGYLPIVVPEAATMFYLSGFKPDDFGGFEGFDTKLLEVKLWQYNFFVNCAKEAAASGAKPILLFDRAIMSGKAYNDDATFEKILSRHNLLPAEVFLMYDAIIHLQSAAIGAEDFYILENNPARQEKTIKEAREKDDRILSCWIGHKKLFVIDNSTNFEDKINRLFHTVCNFIISPQTNLSQSNTHEK